MVNFKLSKDVQNDRETKKESESLTGIEPMTS